MAARSVIIIYVLCVTCLSQVYAEVSNLELSFLTPEENDFLHESIRLSANTATVSTGDGGWVHCFFGLDTVVWREGQMQSLCWGEELSSTTSEAVAISGISRNSYAFLFRGELQVLGGRDFLHWHNHWLTFGPASNWYARDLNGDVPEIIDGRRVARLGTETLWVFDERQQVRRLDIDQGEFTLVGEIQPELKNYLGSFQVIELWDYVAFFGDLGGGIMKKATQEFVMNHELKLASLVGADGWSMVANSLHLTLNQNPEAVIIDADAIFNESAPAVLIIPSAPASAEAGISWDFASWGWAVGLIVGAAGAALIFRRKHPTLMASLAEEVPNLASASEPIQRANEPPVERRTREPQPEDASSDVNVRVEKPEPRSKSKKSDQPAATVAPERKRAPTARGAAVEEIVEALVQGGDRQYTAADLNGKFGIAALSSDESQRARRARLVRQINDIYKREHNRSLILRERDPKDRRHLIYRIKP